MTIILINTNNNDNNDKNNKYCIYLICFFSCTDTSFFRRFGLWGESVKSLRKTIAAGRLDEESMALQRTQHPTLGREHIPGKTFCMFDWIGLREKLQEKPYNYLENLWFPVSIFPESLLFV